MRQMFSTDKYIGIKYKKNGRDRCGLDCYGLGILIYKDYFKIDLPEVSFVLKESVSPSRIHKEFNDKVFNWVKVEKPDKLDLVAYDTVHIKEKKIVSHVAFYIGSGKIIHVNESIGSVVVQKMETYGHEVIGIYRHEKNIKDSLYI